MRKYAIDRHLLEYILDTNDSVQIDSILDYYNEAIVILTEKCQRDIVLAQGISLDTWSRYYAQEETLDEEIDNKINEIIFSEECQTKVNSTIDSIYAGLFEKIETSGDIKKIKYVETYVKLLLEKQKLEETKIFETSLSLQDLFSNKTKRLRMLVQQI
jgi:aspartate/glutamate racemase